MNKNKKAISLADIAKVAGVSNATVSRALNDKEKVSKEMLQRVEKVVEEMGYSPQRVHKKVQDKYLIAVLVDKSINSFYSQVLSALQHNALKFRCISQIIQMPDDREMQTRIIKKIKAIPWLGIISVGFLMQPEEWIKLQEVTEIPIILFNMKVDHVNIGCLQVNFKKSNLIVLQHLLDLGHKRIIYLGDHNDYFVKMQNIIDALEKQGYSYPDQYKISVTHTLEGASQAISRIMMMPIELRPTAIIAFDDDFALQLLNALNYHQLRVPQDISLVGFDNMPLSAHTHPPITTVDVPKDRIGFLLVKLLQQMICRKENEPVGQIFVDGTFIVRNSTAPLEK